MSRRDDIEEFYAIIDELRKKVGGHRLLRDCTGKSVWPQRGLYFFFEDGELRERGKQPRVVRVGTHAVTATSKTTLWNRLHTHRGHAGGGGNHRGSIFRKRIGEALIASTSYPQCARKSWGVGSSAPKDICVAELPIEQAVTKHIGNMPFLWLRIDDAPSPDSHRSHLERNSIGLLSNYSQPPIDPASKHWLGLHVAQETIRKSGLWNTNYVDERYDPAFLPLLRSYVKETQ